MKSRKQAWSIALCLLAAMALAIGLRARSTTAQSSVQPPQHSKSRGGITGQTLVATSLPASMLPTSVLFAEAASDGQNSRSFKSNPDLPPVEEFTLTPPNPALKMYKTMVAVRFPELASEKLASQIPMTLGDQSVVLQRSADDPRIFSASVDFDWKAFAHEQQQRKSLANSGRVIPVFAGRRLLRMDKIEFVDPADIDSALQSHQPLQFTPKIMEDPGFTIQPASELMITNLGVVTDAARTWDSCSGAGTQMGAWTFGKLVTAMTGTSGSRLKADAMVQTWLNQWLSDQSINSFTVAKRLEMTNKIIAPWQALGVDSNGNVDVSKAPFQLNAIVNRIDLGAGSTPTGGEVRFVFGHCSSAGNAFNVILEYGVPASVASGCAGVQNWAEEWHNLDTIFVGTPAFNAALQAITDQIVAAGADSTKPFGSALDQARTNETFLAASANWEQRQFQLLAGGDGSPTLKEGTIAQTPDSQNANGNFNGANSPPGNNAAVLTDFINLNQSAILNGTYVVPATFADPLQRFNGAFLGASALNAGDPASPGYWKGCHPVGGTCVAIASNFARSDFSVGTCNGCHGRETANDPSFQQVSNRVTGSGSPSVLSAFLVGCSFNNGGLGLTGTCPLSDLFPLTAPGQETVQDPVVPPQLNTFGDLVRRQTYMSTVLGGCGSGQLLQSLVRHKINFVH
jgi:hypothetical protein